MCRLLVACALVLLAQATYAVDTAAKPKPPPVPWWKLKASVGYHFSSGDYTGSDNTVIQYVPLVLTADVDRWRVQTTIPWLYVSGPPGFIEGGPTGPIEAGGTNDGLGDVLLRGSYLLPVERLLPADEPIPQWLPYVDMLGLVKFPTASRSDGLGTGEFDFGLDADLTWMIGPWSPFCSLGYRFLGSPPQQHLYDVITGSVGALYRLSPTLSGGTLLDYRQPATAQTGQRLDLVPYVSWLFTPPWSLDSYVSIGLANGSPDVGFGSQLGYTW